MPRPRARPLTNWVLPAPRAPLKPMIQPGAASRPQRSPKAAVSSGLCEMNVTMSGERTDAFLVAQPQSWLWRDLPDATEFHRREGAAPRVGQRHGVSGGDGEEQFKVLAVGQCRQKRRPGRRFGAG